MEADVQQLAQTLLASKLAASNSEAQRMARDMLGVAAKVSADEKKEQIYAVHGYGTPKSAATEQLSNPTPSAEVAAFSSPQTQVASTQPQSQVQQVTLENPVLTTQPHPNMPQQQQAAWQATTSPSPESAPVDQGEVVISSPEEPAQEEFSTPSPANSWADESSTQEPEAVSVQLETNHQQATANYAPSQQATLLATESLGTTGVARPEDRFASQFEGKTLAELSAEAHQESTQEAYEAPQPTPQPEEQTDFFSSSATDSSSDFLNLRSQPEQQMSSTDAASAPSLSTGWPSEEKTPAIEEAAQPPVTPQYTSPVDVPEQQQPQQTTSSFIQEAAPVPPVAQKTERMSPEEKKLQNDVDLAKVFNFANR